MKKCLCGGKAVYSGSHMIDSYKCSKCDYKTENYFDGEDFARDEWDKRNVSNDSR